MKKDVMCVSLMLNDGNTGKNFGIYNTRIIHPGTRWKIIRSSCAREPNPLLIENQPEHANTKCKDPSSGFRNL